MTGSSAESPPAFDVDRRVGGTHLEPLQIGGVADRPGGTTDLAESILEATLRNGVDSFRAHLLSQVVAQIAVECAIHLRLRAKDKGIPCTFTPDNRADQSAIQVEKFESTVHEHLEDRRIAAGSLIVIGERLYMDAPVRFRCDR